MDWSSCNSNGIATLDCIPLLIANIIWWVLTFASIMAILFIIITGYRFITSGGDPKKLEQARKTFAYALLGLLLVFASFFIVHTIATVTGVGCLNPNKVFSFTSCE